MNTREEFDAEVEAILNDAVADESVDPSNVAEAIGKAADYAEGIMVTKVKKVSVTHAELLAFYDSQKELLPAVVDKAYSPISIMIRYIDNDGWGTSGNPWIVKLGSITLSVFNTQIGAGSVKAELRPLLGNSNTTEDYFNKALTISANNNLASPVNALAKMDVYITYYEITL